MMPTRITYNNILTVPRTVHQCMHAGHFPSPRADTATLQIPSGSTCGIVGRTGSGKSSLMLVLFDLIDITAGSVLLDGVDVSRVALDSLRRQISIIPQDPLLFSGASHWHGSKSTMWRLCAISLLSLSACSPLPTLVFFSVSFLCLHDNKTGLLLVGWVSLWAAGRIQFCCTEDVRVHSALMDHRVLHQNPRGPGQVGGCMLACMHTVDE